MDLVAIANMQSAGIWSWLIFHDPFTFCIFWIYFTCAMASVNRAPFDLAEAESELVAGFHTEYSGLRWSFFFMAEYGSMFLVSGLAVILFFGGWNGPLAIMSDKIIGVIPGLGLAGQPNAWGFIAGCVGAANFIMKATIGVTVMIWVRWTLPRLRIDQVMTMCLKYCVPLAAACFLGAVFVKAEIFGLGYLSVDAWLPGLRSDRVEVREGWMTEVEGEGVTLSTEKTLVHGDG
jgi:NADH-quinone oxidoreductase subunit H